MLRVAAGYPVCVGLAPHGLNIRSAGLRRAAGPPFGNVGVDHRGADVTVAQLLLDSADVVAVPQEVDLFVLQSTITRGRWSEQASLAVSDERQAARGLPWSESRSGRARPGYFQATLSSHSAARRRIRSHHRGRCRPASSRISVAGEGCDDVRLGHRLAFCIGHWQLSLLVFTRNERYQPAEGGRVHAAVRGPFEKCRPESIDLP